MMITHKFASTGPAVAAALLTLFLAWGMSPASENKTLEVGKFSALDASQGLPDQWKPLTFKNIDAHTDYRLVSVDGTTVIKADSRASASGLIRKITIDPKAYPVISWRWKIENIYENGDVTRKSGDDYPARIYIAFAYDPDRVGFFEKAKFSALKLIYGEYPPTGAINYIWASRAEQGRITDNPYTDRVKMIVIESGSSRVGEWVTETRNIYEDYKRAFGTEPPNISGVAIMTDSDNTGESAVAFYGDIIFTKD